MSKTYRRKNERNKYNWYDTEEEFNFYRDSACTAEETKNLIEQAAAAHPEPRVFEWWKPEDQVARKLYYKAFYDVIYSDDYRRMMRSEDFRSRSRGCVEYREYVKIGEAIFHSDCGSTNHWTRSVPSWFNNLYFERPMRRSVKAALKRAIMCDTLDELVLDEHTNGGAWAYW